MATTKKKTTTPTPSGLKITRSNAAFTCSWSGASSSTVSDIDGKWTITKRDGTTVTHNSVLTNASTKATFTFDLRKWYPGNGQARSKSNTVDKITYTVTFKGVSGSDGSKSASCTYDLKQPKKPELTATTNDNITTLRVKAEEPSNEPERWVTHVTYQYWYHKASVAKSSTPQFDSGHVRGMEDSTTAATGLSPNEPYVLEARAFASSIEGDSDAVYIEPRYFARPNKATNVRVSKRGTGRYNFKWDPGATTERPDDYYEVKYIDKPYHDTIQESDAFSPAGHKVYYDKKRSKNYDDSSNDLGGIPAGKARYFRVATYHDGNMALSDVAAYRDFQSPGKPTDVDFDYSEAHSPCPITITWTWPNDATEGYTAALYLEDEDHTLAGSISYPQSTWTSSKPFAWTEARRVGVRVTGIVHNGTAIRSDTVWSPVKEAMRLMIEEMRVEPRPDCESVELRFTHPADAANADGIIVAWADDRDAFISNVQPETATFDSETLWDHNKGNVDNIDKLVVRGLERSKAYYFWAKKFAEEPDGTKYGPWATGMYTTSSDPEALAPMLREAALSVARSWVRVDDPHVQAGWSWSFDSDTSDLDTAITGATVHAFRHTDGHPFSRYTDTQAVAAWNFYGDVDSGDLDLSRLAPGVYDLAVTVTNKRGAATSIRGESGEAAGLVEVSVIQQPECSLSLVMDCFEDVEHEYTEEEIAMGAENWTEHVLRLPDPSFSCSCTGGAEMALAIKAAIPFEYETAEGRKRVYRDEVVWSTPTLGGEVHAEGVSLVDGCIYMAELVAVEPTSGLMSEIERVRFTVDWERKAEAPSGEVSADPSELAATIVATAPDGAEEGDYCTIYRVTPDTVSPIAEDAAWGEEYTDLYAPYSGTRGADLRYRVSCTTPYGSQAWTDVDYELLHRSVRIDFPGGSLELPFNLVSSDSRTKDFEVRNYLGGSRRAFVSPAVGRSQALSSDLVMGMDDEKLPAVMALSRHTGTSMVRTPLSLAYVAVVEASIDNSYESRKYAVSIEATETDPNGEYTAWRAE